TLIYDCMIGDATLFQRADMVEAAWRIVQPVLDAWAAEKPTDFPNYVAGSAGPEAADRLLAGDGGRARRPIGNKPGGGSKAENLAAARRCRRHVSHRTEDPHRPRPRRRGRVASKGYPVCDHQRPAAAWDGDAGRAARSRFTDRGL